MVVLGAGNVGWNAAWMAAGLEAEVDLLDKNVERLRWVDQIQMGRITTLTSNRGQVERAVEQADLVLIDHDRVEETNLARQNFTRGEVGMLKSEALAKRLSARYDRGVGYSALPVSQVGLRLPGIMVGCVDNGPARRDMAEKARGFSAGSGQWGYPSWWVAS